MNPDEFRHLRSLARQKKTSVAELIRTAVREKYLAPEQPDRKAIVESILKMNLPVTDWDDVCAEVEAAHVDLS